MDRARQNFCRTRRSIAGSYEHFVCPRFHAGRCLGAFAAKATCSMVSLWPSGDQRVEDRAAVGAGGGLLGGRDGSTHTEAHMHHPLSFVSVGFALFAFLGILLFDSSGRRQHHWGRSLVGSFCGTRRSTVSLIRVLAALLPTAPYSHKIG